MKASQFFKTTQMFDSFEIIKQCARCGEHDRHAADCFELELEAQARLEAALQESISMIESQVRAHESSK